MPTTIRPAGLFETPGSFNIGCNWWASHAGTNMWRDWRPEVVEVDFARMASVGIQSVRMFPLWPDFQPLNLLRGGGGVPYEYRHGEQLMPDRSGVDPIMLERLAFVATTAHKHGIGLLIGLVTGWMSGRFFAPLPIAHLNPITDAESMLWQVRMVRAIVTRLRDMPAVLAWDLGNECNCMGQAPSVAAASHWTATISDAIRGCDATRPVVSGMHSLLPDPARCGNWTIQDQAEHCDVLTTHPYPLFTAYSGQDRIDDPRTTHHPTAETRMYADLGRRSACAEEIGTLGPVLGDEASVSSFVRVNLFSLWANDCRGLMWWCGFDQSHLSHAPYDWAGIERELGMFRADLSPRPFLEAFKEIAALRAKLPGGILPPARADVVCILTRDQEQWPVAWAAWILAKQAGFSLRFAWGEEAIPDAQRYILPSLDGGNCVPRRNWLDLLSRVEKGAELLITLNGPFLSPLNDALGFDIVSRRDRRGPENAHLPDGTVLPVTKGLDRVIAPRPGTEILARGDNGAVLATRHKHGRGRIDTWGLPVEAQLTATLGSCDEGAPAWHRIYTMWCDPFAAGRTVVCDGAKWLALTEHELSPTSRVIVAVNHDRTPADGTLRLAKGWRVVETLHGPAQSNGTLKVAAQNVAAIRIER